MAAMEVSGNSTSCLGFGMAGSSAWARRRMVHGTSLAEMDDVELPPPILGNLYILIVYHTIPINCGCNMSCLVGQSLRKSLPFIFFLKQLLHFLHKSCKCPANSASEVHTQHFCDGNQSSHEVLLSLRFRTFALQGQKLAWWQGDRVAQDFRLWVWWVMEVALSKSI